ncbi:MAG: WbqC family protein [Candidatus Sericytochromatia bacterium]
MRQIVIMQPYLWPYLGYFQLIHACEDFVFLDDATYRPRGWIHRNVILHKGQALRFTLPASKASQNKRICDIPALVTPHWRRQFYRMLKHTYARAPFYPQTIELLMSVLAVEGLSLADIACASVETVAAQLGLKRHFARSSQALPNYLHLKSPERLFALCRHWGAGRYVNAAGGRALYAAEDFAAQSLDLLFLESEKRAYPQLQSPFVPNLSVIDFLMYVLPDDYERYLSAYRLVPSAEKDGRQG